jgi:hypothetical protein
MGPRKVVIEIGTTNALVLKTFLPTCRAVVSILRMLAGELCMEFQMLSLSSLRVTHSDSSSRVITLLNPMWIHTGLSFRPSFLKVSLFLKIHLVSGENETRILTFMKGTYPIPALIDGANFSEPASNTVLVGGEANIDIDIA